MVAYKMALVRSPESVEALRSSSEQVQNWFAEAGFGMNLFDSGAPTGYYPAEDHGARMYILNKLRETAPAQLPATAFKGGFNLTAFTEAAITARPFTPTEPHSVAEKPAAAAAAVEPVKAKPGLLGRLFGRG